MQPGGHDNDHPTAYLPRFETLKLMEIKVNKEKKVVEVGKKKSKKAKDSEQLLYFTFFFFTSSQVPPNIHLRRDLLQG